MIGIIDYGAGNLSSVKKALDYIGEKSFISNDIKELDMADGYILPGVGAFGEAMKQLNDSGLDNYVKNVVKTKKLLGICLGMQLLFDKSYEFGEYNGLSLIEGSIVKIPSKNGFKIPHMGWNSLEIVKKSEIINGILNGSYVYFVHSFMAKTNFKNIIAYTDYSTNIPVIVKDDTDNVFGMQYHPEKSDEIGLTMLRNFGGMIK